MKVNLDSVRYSQDSVAGTFTDGRYIEDTFRELLYGNISVDNISPIQVIRDEQGIYWALTGNRRLYVFKRLQSLGIVTSIPVDVQSVEDNSSRFRDRMTTVNDGTDITVRQSIAVIKIDNIEAEWLRTTGRQKLVAVPAVVIPVKENELVSNMSSLSLLSEPNERDAFRNYEATLEHYRCVVEAEQEKREKEQRLREFVAERRRKERLEEEIERKEIALRILHWKHQEAEHLEAKHQEAEHLRAERQEAERQEAERQDSYCIII